MPFQAHVELLELFIARRAELVERIQALLNAQRKPVQYLRDRRLLARHFEDCFYTLRGVTPGQARLHGQLEQAHWARGFRPREIAGMHNDLVDPAEMMRRAFHLWQQTRWPGRSGRDHYAQTLFNLYLIRQLALLSMRAWDVGASDADATGGSGTGDAGTGRAGNAAARGAGERLAQVQQLLDRLRSSTPSDQPVFVRDARWLIPLAQSPATNDLAPYFEVADEIATAFAEDDRLEIQKAVVRMAGGHLRSYLHYYITQKGVPLDDSRLVQITRKANALDYSLLLRGLVPLLEAYERAVQDRDAQKRLALADAICQGVSPDPELFVNRIELLGAYSMVEHLFTTTDGDGRAVYTPMGERHVRLLEEYEARIGRVTQALNEDCRQFRPADGGYSPFGAIYGFASNLLEHMALKSVEREAVTQLGLEDVFRGGGADKLDWVNGWRSLPHVDPQVAKLYAYPQKFAAEIFARIERALSTAASAGEASARVTSATTRTGRLFVRAENDRGDASKLAPIPDLPLRYIPSSDEQIVAAHKAEACDQAQLSKERVEGFFVVSYETAGGWVAITKDLLTEVLGAGRDAKIVGLPGLPIERLRLMCRGLVSG